MNVARERIRDLDPEVPEPPQLADLGRPPVVQAETGARAKPQTVPLTPEERGR